MSQFYICKRKDESLYFRETINFKPEDAVVKLKDDSLRNKKIKLIDKPLLNPDGTEQTDIDGNVITEKVAVLDVEAQAEYEAKVKAEKDARDAAKLELDTKIKAVKDQTKTKKMTDEQITEAFDLVFELLGI